ncbi:PREDICTED: uncharacterized protein LOC109388378 [Hipposideros armiger]|uniref:Uncharacterized protein LOC109388378 n=1 Tax=Hipposideros armiger TaxID=186990 RepID=A0A8B7S9Z3_HIPAR|nr:PREDICTED: uncharacterized protein LOC109388378 [Hipposideros armiger]
MDEKRRAGGTGAVGSAGSSGPREPVANCRVGLAEDRPSLACRPVAHSRSWWGRCRQLHRLPPQWPLHLEQVGEDVPISTSRVSCEARRRETPGTRPGRQGCPALCRRGPSLLAGGREARGGAGRKSCALPARGRCGPRLRPGPGSGGPGASRATDGRRATLPWRDLPRSRVGLIRGRGRLFPGHLSKTYAGRELSLILSYQPGLRWGF